MCFVSFVSSFGGEWLEGLKADAVSGFQLKAKGKSLGGESSVGTL